MVEVVEVGVVVSAGSGTTGGEAEAGEGGGRRGNACCSSLGRG